MATQEEGGGWIEWLNFFFRLFDYLYDYSKSILSYAESIYTKQSHKYESKNKTRKGHEDIYWFGVSQNT